MNPTPSETYRNVFGGQPALSAWAPGRVNLIGEHTDYNEGYVLPLAIDRGITICGEAKAGRTVTVHSAGDGTTVEFSLDHLAPHGKSRWVDYLQGTADQLQKRGVKLGGFQAVVQGDLPSGAGLSSSAALEIATARFFQKASGFQLDDLEMVRAARDAENQFVGVQCGIMDPYASYMGKAGHALFIDCRSLENRLVPLTGPWRLVVCNTGIKRSLANSAYNERREQCEAGVKALSQYKPGIRSLRDVSLEDLERYGKNLEPLIFKRVRHVVSEDQRVLESVEALQKNDLGKVGQLMHASHESLSLDYNVSCVELDFLVGMAKKTKGVAGGRMMGAGFGGCTVNLVEEAAVEAFREAVDEAYQFTLGSKPETYVFQPADGAKYKG